MALAKTRNLLTILLLPLFTSAAPAPAATFNLVCSTDNDLYRILQTNGLAVHRFDDAAAALAGAGKGEALLLLADGYPQGKTPVSEIIYRRAAQKKLRLYIEYPADLADSIRTTKWERGVITSDFFGSDLPPVSIVTINDCHYIPVQAGDPLMVIAKVAGYDSAVYGLEGTEAFPILYRQSDNVLVATTKLSQFVTGRYGPHNSWRAIWTGILRWLVQNDSIPDLEWQDSVHPNLAADAQVNSEDYSAAWNRGVDWYINSRLLMHESWQNYFDEEGNYTGPIEDVRYEHLKPGDGRFGVFECFGSAIRYDGSQKIFFTRRSDCTSETAMAFALRSALTGDPDDKMIAANLQDFIYFNSPLQGGPRGDSSSPSYGFVSWSLSGRSRGVYYADDNARVVLGSLATAASLKSDRWNEAIVKTILANFRTTGPKGFKPRRLEEPDLQENGWQHYWNLEYTHFAPHYQSWIWACYLWLYDKTGYAPLLERTKTGIANMMAAYPDNWHWTNGMQQERARMILPLAWLIRAEDTPQHRQWLNRIVSDLLAFQDKSGAIREEIGGEGKGSYGPPVSNEAYGTREATLMQSNGDPVADMLYTSNFAIFSLTEAAAATGDPAIKKAAEKLAEFLVKIQVRSEDHPELDGAWFRAFDFRKWEYWASDADLGWGAWATETGWTQGWITSMLMMQEMNSSLWDFTSNVDIAPAFKKIKKQMLPDSLFDQESRRPKIKKLGTIDLDLVETTPVVFRDRLYRFEYVRPGYKANKTGDSYFRFIDHDSGEATPAFGHGYHLGSAFVEGDSVYVTAVDIWDGENIVLFVSGDLATWSSRPVLSLPGYGIFNTSLCKADSNYVLMYEIGKPPEEAGKRFTARFATSPDLVTWTVTPRECTYSKDRYTAPHALRYLDGWFYNFYLEAHNGYETRVVRSRDLVNWESSPRNPVLKASPEDKLIANPRLSAEQRQLIAEAKNINNSDIDFCEYRGKLIISYSWGNQHGTEFLAEAVFEGTLEEFLKGWFE